jgi:polyferredoxin
LCIDACDAIMRKIGRPERLIAYDTDINIHRRKSGKAEIYRPVRMRTILYAAVICLAGGLMLYTLATRTSMGLSIIHERNPLYVRLSDGAIRNVYVARVINKELETRSFRLSVSGLAGSIVDLVELPAQPDGRLVIEVGPDQTREIRVLVTDYGFTPPPSTPVVFHLTDTQTGERASAADYFRAP